MISSELACVLNRMGTRLKKVSSLSQHARRSHFPLRFKMASRSSQREQRAQRTVETDDQEDDLTKVEYETSEGVEVIPTFDGIGLREDLLRGIYAYGL